MRQRRIKAGQFSPVLQTGELSAWTSAAFTPRGKTEGEEAMKLAVLAVVTGFALLGVAHARILIRSRRAKQDRT